VWIWYFFLVFYCSSYVLSMFAVAEHLLAQHNAVKMLHGRIRIILDYIKAVEAGVYWSQLRDDSIRKPSLASTLL